MLIDVLHQTVYRYEVPATYSIQRLHMMPLSFDGQRVVDWRIEVPGAEVALQYEDAFGNRVHQDVRAAERINMLASTIDELAKLVPGNLPAELANNVARARAMKLVNTVELTLEAASGSDQDDDYAFRDFSREGIEMRKAGGRAIALETLRPKFEQ